MRQESRLQQQGRTGKSDATVGITVVVMRRIGYSTVNSLCSSLRRKNFNPKKNSSGLRLSVPHETSEIQQSNTAFCRQSQPCNRPGTFGLFGFGLAHFVSRISDPDVPMYYTSVDQLIDLGDTLWEPSEKNPARRIFTFPGARG